MPKRLLGSVSRKMAFVLFVMGTVGSLVIGVFLLQQGRRTVLETEIVRGQSLAHTLRFTIESWLVEKLVVEQRESAEVSLNRLIHNVASLDSVRGVKVFDRAGRILADAGVDDGLAIRSDDPLLAQSIDSRQIINKVDADDSQLHFYVPLVGGAYQAGLPQPDVSASLVFVLDYRKSLAASDHAALTTSMLPVVLIGILTLILYTIMQRMVLRPTQILAEQADRLGQGDLSARSGARIKSEDELGRLAAAFDDMAEHLESARAESLRADAALRQSEARLRRMVDANIIGVILWDFDGNILDANDEYLRAIGFNRDDLKAGRIHWDKITPPEFADADRKALHELTTRQVCTPYEKEYFRKDGSRVPVLIGAVAFNGERRGMAFVLDTSDLRKAERALQQSEERYRRLVENAPEAIVVMDVERGKFIDANPAAERLFGMSVEELRQRGPADVSPPTQANGRPSVELAMENIRQTVAGGSPHFEWLHTSRTGAHIPCEIWLTRLPSEGRVLVRGSITNIAERKRLEDQVLQLQKVESIGRLAGGVAHDFNNLLTSIIGFAELAAKTDKPDEYLARLLESAQRGAGLTQQLLAYARRKIIKPELADLGKVIVHMAPLIRRLIGEDVELIIRPATGIGTVLVDIGSLEQVIMNLCVNARDAMPDGGHLTIETGVVNLDEQYAATRAEVIPGRHAMLAISDTGTGIDEKILGHIFEPFFTTKPQGRGTGLGLAMCHGIIKQAGGHIAVYSEVGKGTTMKIYLPAHVQTAVERKSSRIEIKRKTGTETILFVEDDDLIRACTRESLSDMGYKVLVATNGVEALKLADEHDGAIDLLITDVVMPRMSGQELATALMQRRGNIKVLYASGYTENAIVHHGVLKPDVNFIQKPFGEAELSQMIRKLCDK